MSSNTFDKRNLYFSTWNKENAELDQNYHIDRQCRHSRLVHLAGILEGLNVNKEPEVLALKIEPGTAVNPLGQQIILQNFQVWRLPQNTVDGNGVLYIQYQEKQIDPLPANRGGAYQRIQDDPRIDYAESDRLPTDAVALAQLTIKDGQIQEPINLSVRQYSGLRLPTATEEALTLRSAGDSDSKKAILSGSLSVQGDLSATGKLSVTDSATFDSSLTTSHLNVNGDTNLKGKLSVTDSATFDSSLTTGNLNVNGETNLKGKLSVTDSATFDSSVTTGHLNVNGDVQITGTRLKSANGWGIVETNKKDWLRINPDQSYPAIALHKPVAIGTGGLAIGEWTQPAQGELKVTQSAYLATVGGKVGIGTTSPSEKLEVSGNIKATGSITGNTLSVSSKVGVGTSTSEALLDVGGKSDTEGQISLQLRSGNTANNYKSSQITFGFNNTAEYRHVIKTRHNSNGGSGNAFDFYVWNKGQNQNTSDIGSLHTMTLNGGNVGIGTTDPKAKLQIINTEQDANGNTLILGSTDKSNLRLGYHTNYSWIQSHGSKPLAINPIGTNNVGIGTITPSEKLEVSGNIKATGSITGNSLSVTGNVGIGTEKKDYKLTVGASANHLQIRREKTEKTGGNVVFLELFQDDNNPAEVPEVYPSIRFHHGWRYWHRIEARPDGLHFKTGRTDKDTYTRIFAEGAIVTGMILMWSGKTTQIPVGWALCNGQNSTPDLRDRFILGTADNSGNKIGGESSHTHLMNDAGRHNHGFGDGGSMSLNTGWGSTAMYEAGNHTHTINPCSTLPPYYKLAFIIKL